MKDIESFDIVTFGDKKEVLRRKAVLKHIRECPIPDNEYLMNMGLFLTPQNLSRILFMDFLYKQIIDVQGVICEFGCRWGQNSSLFSAMRGIYEPFNRLRKIVAFDTFEGFVSVSEEDGQEMIDGGYSVNKGYEAYLDKILEFQEQESPMSHIKKYEIVKGDVSKTVPLYLDNNPETVIALAYFDLDLYQPTKDTLNAIKGSLTRGSIIAFDEVNDHSCPGETIALKEVLGLDKYHIKRFPYNARTSYLIID